MAQQLGFQSVSTEDPKSVPRTQVRYCNSDALFWTLQASVSSCGHNSPPPHTLPRPKKTHKRNKSLKERKRLLIDWPVRRDTIISCSPLRLFPWWCPGNRSQHRDLERQPRSHPASQSPPLLDSRQGRAQWHIISHKETKRSSRCKE